MFCSLSEMENYQGDLTDIVRASTSGAGPYSYAGCATGVSSDFSLDPTSGDHLWPQLPSDDPMNFGDPFSTTQDPLLHHQYELHMSGSTFDFATSNSPEMIVGSHGFRGGAAVSERPCNIFSRTLQISPSSTFGDGVTPCDSPAVGNSPSSTSIKASAAAAAVAPSSDNLINNSDSSSKPLCLIDNSGLQISSPRNPAIKRRKSQVKKVVCIPAPAPANSRPSSGEVVPSDLWAWRKYGQKPIKGSPYPRGYYRCSSSKGCSARKQVERSRTDPNMLVITYTSEHNHPWPTQRNALAGSTRAQPSRSNMINNNASSSASKTTASVDQIKPTPKDEDNSCNDGELASPIMAAANYSSAASGAIKEEMEDQMEKLEVEVMDERDQEFPYELTLPVSNHCDTDFFSDFGEMNDQTDPLNNYLLFCQNLSGNNDGSNDQSKAAAASLDPFSHLYEWPAETNSFKEAKGS